jgi:hypothetical protein
MQAALNTCFFAISFFCLGHGREKHTMTTHDRPACANFRKIVHSKKSQKTRKMPSYAVSCYFLLFFEKTGSCGGPGDWEGHRCEDSPFWTKCDTICSAQFAECAKSAFFDHFIARSPVHGLPPPPGGVYKSVHFAVFVHPRGSHFFCSGKTSVFQKVKNRQKSLPESNIQTTTRKNTSKNSHFFVIFFIEKKMFEKFERRADVKKHRKMTFGAFRATPVAKNTSSPRLP